MIRRIIYIVFLVALIGSIGYFYISYNAKSNKVVQQNPFVAVPRDAALVFNVNDLNRFSSAVKSQGEMLAGVGSLPLFQQTISSLVNLDSVIQKNPEVESILNNTSYTVTWQMVGPKRMEPLYIFTFRDKEQAQQLKYVLKKSIPETGKVKEYNGVEIYPVQITALSKDEFFFFQDENYVVLGVEPMLLEKSIGEIDLGGTITAQADFMNVYETAGSHVPVNIFVNFKNLAKLAAVWSEPGKSKLMESLAGVGTWAELDVKLDDKAFVLDGFSAVGGMSDYFSIIQAQAPVKFSAYKIMPITARNFVFMGIDNISDFRSKYTGYIHDNKDQKHYEIALKRIETKTGENPVRFFDGMLEKEVCAIWDTGLKEEYNNMALMRVKSHRSAESDYKDFLSRYAGTKKVGLSHYTEQVKIGQTNEFNAYYFPFENALSLLYGGFVNDAHFRYVCFYDNFMIVAPSVSALKSIVMENMRQRTLEADERFMAFSQTLSEHTSLYWYMDMQSWDGLVKNFFNDAEENTILGKGGAWEGFQAIGVQVAALNNLVYNNIYMRYDPYDTDRPQTVWESKLDSTIITKPALVENHYTHEKEICVQDAANQLYLMSNAGIVLWKKKLDSPIISEITQIDYFKNGKLQLLFNTAEKIYLLDRNGNNVERYPVNLPSKATAGLSVFDYDNKKNYRIFIPCENRKVYLFNQEGNINTGWKFTQTDHLVKNSIQYFRIANKDYIVFKDKTRVYIQDRQGSTRIRLKQQFSPSVNNSIYEDYNTAEQKHRFVTTASDGTLKFIYMDGTVKESLLTSCNDNHFYALQDLDGDINAEHLFVNGKKMQVFSRAGKEVFQYEFGGEVDMKPNLYQFASNNIKIGITERHSDELYLFNADGSIYKGFPLKGQTEFSIGFLNQQGYRFNLLVGGKNGFLLNYKVK